MELDAPRIVCLLFRLAEPLFLSESFQVRSYFWQSALVGPSFLDHGCG